MLFFKKAESNNTSIKPVLSDRTKKELSYAIRVAVGHRSIEQFSRILKMIDPKPIVSLIKMNYNELPDRQLLRKIANASENRITHTHLYNLIGYSEFDPEEDRSWRSWTPKKGDIIFGDLGMTEDSIQGGKRPILILGNDLGLKYSDIVFGVPISSKKKGNNKMHVYISKEYKLEKNSYILCEQTRVLSKRRFFFGGTPWKICSLDEQILQEVYSILEFQLGIKPLMFNEEHVFELIFNIKSLEQNIKTKKANNLVNLFNEKLNELITYCNKHSKDYKHFLNEYDRINNYGYNAVSI